MFLQDLSKLHFRWGNLDSTEGASWKRLSNEGHGFSRAVKICRIQTALATEVRLLPPFRSD